MRRAPPRNLNTPDPGELLFECGYHVQLQVGHLIKRAADPEDNGKVARQKPPNILLSLSRDWSLRDLSLL